MVPMGEKLRACYEMIEAHEQQQDFVYDFVVRWRPDLLPHSGTQFLAASGGGSDRARHLRNVCVGHIDPLGTPGDWTAVVPRQYARAYFWGFLDTATKCFSFDANRRTCAFDGGGLRANRRQRAEFLAWNWARPECILKRHLRNARIPYTAQRQCSFGGELVRPL